jgi:hypothetical protein
MIGIGAVVILLLIVISIAASSGEGHVINNGNMVLKLIYTFLIGIFLAVFVGVGIDAFYPGPKFSEAPAVLKYCSGENGKNAEMSTDLKAEIENFDRVEKAYRIESQKYNKNVSIFSLVASILIVIGSLTLFKKILLIADGLLLGGVLSLIYSVMRGFDTEGNKFRFFVVSIGLIVSLVLGYVKFIIPDVKNKKS